MAYASGTISRIGDVVTRKRVLRCSKCSDTKGNDGFKWCMPCRLAGALASKEWYWDHVERKLCTRCCDAAFYTRSHGRYRKCDHHRTTLNAYNREWRSERRSKGLCARCGANSPDTWLCETCGAAQRGYMKAAARMKRAA